MSIIEKSKFQKFDPTAFRRHNKVWRFAKNNIFYVPTRRYLNVLIF
jgi:hypothetical protein